MIEKCKHHRMCLRETNEGPEWYCSQCCKSFVVRTKSCDDCPEKQLAQNALEKCGVLKTENEGLQKENNKLSARINLLVEATNSLKTEITELNNENKDLREKIQQMEIGNERLREEILRINNLKTQNEDLQKENKLFVDKVEKLTDRNYELREIIRKMEKENQELRDLNARLSGPDNIPYGEFKDALEQENKRLAEENVGLLETVRQYKAEIQQANEIIRENEEDAKIIEELNLKIKLLEERILARDKMHVVDELQIGILKRSYRDVAEKLVEVVKSDEYQPKEGEQ